eukprot:5971058-Prymnesium_polylepis.1
MVVEAQEGFAEMLEFAELRPKAVQQSDDFDTVYAQAAEAQTVLTGKVATRWEIDPDPKLAFLKHPAKGTAKKWVEDADDPGIKGEKRSKEKMENDYENHANCLKDLSRLTLRFTEPKRLCIGMEGLQKAGFRIVILKNKWKFPTPLGYSDLNMVLGVPLEGQYAGVEYLCEVQLNLQEMLRAKNEAHKPYEIIRSRLPQLCQGTAVDSGKLENFITERLNTSSLEGAVAVLLSKSEGLFLYAHLLSEHLKNEFVAGK